MMVIGKPLRPQWGTPRKTVLITGGALTEQIVWTGLWTNLAAAAGGLAVAAAAGEGGGVAPAAGVELGSSSKPEARLEFGSAEVSFPAAPTSQVQQLQPTRLQDMQVPWTRVHSTSSLAMFQIG